MWKKYYSVGCECKFSTTIMENSLEVPQKRVKIEPTYGLAIRLLGIYPKEMKLVCRRNI